MIERVRLKFGVSAPLVEAKRLLLLGLVERPLGGGACATGGGRGVGVGGWGGEGEVEWTAGDGPEDGGRLVGHGELFVSRLDCRYNRMRESWFRCEM